MDPVFRGRIEKPEELLKLMNASVADFCTPTATRCTICSELLFAIFGYDAPQVNYVCGCSSIIILLHEFRTLVEKINILFYCFYVD